VSRRTVRRYHHSASDSLSSLHVTLAAVYRYTNSFYLPTYLLTNIRGEAIGLSVALLQNPNVNRNSIRARNVDRDNNYNIDDDDDEYGFVTSGATQSISPRQVDVGKKLAEGKFAVVKTGALTVNNESHPVAVKMLRRT